MELVITRLMDRIICAYFNGGRLVRAYRCEGEDADFRVGDIYVGKVKNIVKNINAAFIDIGAGEPYFMQFRDKGGVRRENELIVQVAREGMGSKRAALTDGISITGRFLIINGSKRVNVSGKIKNKSRKKKLKEMFSEEDTKKYGFIIRTNARDADDSDIAAEKYALMELYDSILKAGDSRALFSKLYAAPPGYIEAVRDCYAGEMERIVTDIPEIYGELKSYIAKSCPDLPDMLSLYGDASYTLDMLFGISENIKKALRRKVWLDSGAYIVIDVTEACVVVDVNSGKMIKGKKDAEDTFFKINREAAKEIMLQLRLRNLSGIIIIDFIDMKSPENNGELVKILSDLAAKDPISCNVVGITKLGLVEMTRKKLSKPLHEQFKMSGEALCVI